MTADDQLERYQRLVRDFVAAEGAGHYQQQFHPDLSPSGWHLGHCVFTENYWIREVVAGQPLAIGDRELYVPEFSYKPARGRQLPDFAELIDWAGREQDTNRRRLRALPARSHPLLKGAYLTAFLIQHYAQHYETLCQIRIQRQWHAATGMRVRRPLHPAGLDARSVCLPAGEYRIGRRRGNRPYDNESPCHTVRLAGCRLMSRPVSNAEYLAFMVSGGYDDAGYWSAAGRDWYRRRGVRQPGYWRLNADGHWYGIDTEGAHALQPDAPVAGLSYHEAAAFAAWAGGRLPHEHEWEAARRQGLLTRTGRVWEWCANAFHPYAGFQAWPYEGYSVPYFDADHRVLRGGSQYTRRVIKRPSFRNYYERDKRHLCAGVRVVWD